MVSPEVEVEDFQEVEDLLLVEVEREKCLQLHAATVEKNAKCLSDPQTANLFTAATVSKRWVEDQIQEDRKGLSLEHQHQVLTKTKFSLMI